VVEALGCCFWLCKGGGAVFGGQKFKPNQWGLVSGMPLEMVAEGDGIRCWGGVDEVQVVVWLSNWEVVLPHF
jgi:hypothetical protein